LDIQLPHDALIGTKPGYQNSTACPDGCSGNSFYPRHVLWYRKSFKLPSDWEGDSAWLEFQGSFRETTVWINGEKVAYHDSGYLPFRVRLDNVSSIKYGDEDTNEIAVFVDPDNGDEGARSHGSGWYVISSHHYQQQQQHTHAHTHTGGMRVEVCIVMCTYIELQNFMSNLMVYLRIRTSRGLPLTIQSRNQPRFTFLQVSQIKETLLRQIVL